MTFRFLERACRWVPLLSVALLVGASGCSLIQTTVDLPVRAVKAVLPGGVETEPVDPVDLQEDMLRFSDNFLTSTSKAAEQLKRDGQPIPRAELLTIKVTLATVRGPLRLSGDGTLAISGRLAFTGEARSEPGRERDLEAVLALVGPRRPDGAHAFSIR